MSTAIEQPQPHVGFELQRLPAFLRVPNVIVDKLGMLGMSAPALTPEHLTRVAGRRAGLSAEFPDHVGEALEVLCRSLHDDANLHWFGRTNLRNLIVTGLAERLLVEDVFRRHPELEAQELVPPVIVTGLPRSGTTFLHRLLSVPAAATGVPLHHHLFPTPRRLPTSRIEAEVLFHPWKRACSRYGLDAIHFVRPGLPDECNFGMRLGMRSVIFWATAPTYGYLTWLLDQDLRESYQFYRRVLLLHQARNPGKRLTLKCPHHLAWLPALTAALPEAHIVQTHRDPTQTLPSECKLILSLQGLATREIDWRRTVAHNRLKVTTFAERSVVFANTAAGAKILHVDYRRLVSNPISLVAEIHDHFGLDRDQADVDALERFFADNRQHKHGTNRYSLAQFELEKSDVDAAFAGYRDRFLSSTIEA